MHIEIEDLTKFQKGLLEPEKLIMVFEHIEKCNYCAEQLMNLEAEEIIQAPSYLKDRIIKRTQLIDVKAEVKIKETSKKIQLFLYGLKTTAAVLMALLLLFSVGQIKTMDYSSEYLNNTKVTSSLSNQLQEKSNDVASMMNQLSNRIVNGGLNQ
ncbi:MAG: hypothetical protein ACERKZ_00395 [Lachnotalea sp.]